MPDPTNAGPAQEQLETVVSEKFSKIYANSVNLDMTPWDFSLIFGELKKSGNTMIIEQNISIVMSPQHTKALANVLVTQVKEYERLIGEIKLPPQPQAQVPTEPKAPMATTGIKTN
jgi:lambda repressor-like predicted transcriptional regulator